MSIMRIDNKEIITDDIFQIVIENFPDIVHSVDTDGRIVFTNRKAEQLLGYSRQELIGMNVRRIYADEILEAMEKGFKSLKQSGDKVYESILKDKFGNRIPVEIRSFGIYDDKGNFVRTFSILRDIRQLKELQSGLIHSERLAAIGEMSAGIAHDINNPLSVIVVYAHMMREDLKKITGASVTGIEQLEAMSADISKAAASIEQLVKHLRDFSRSVKDKPQVLDLHRSLSDAVFLVQTKIKNAAVTVKTDIGKDCHLIVGEASNIEHLFANLISNACDALEDRADRIVTLTIEPYDRDGAHFWKVNVADTGKGIPKELIGNIFNPFFTTKEKGKGTGLGLSIVRGIVKDHRGEISVVSEPGRGTIFSVLLPQMNLADSNANDEK
jgi:PAS domain S-box-containing protein